MSSSRLEVMADGLLSVLDERLAPPGMGIAEHYLHVARKLHDAEIALAQLEIQPGPFDVSNPTLKKSDAGYALLETARALFGFAVRLRSRFTGQHATRAGEPLRAGLRKLAEDVEPQDSRQLLLSASHALIVVSRVSEIASNPEAVRAAGVSLDDPIQYLVSEGVLPILQLAVMVQDGDLD
jgi:hypothetical protein